MSRKFFDAIKQGNLGEVQHLLSINPGLIHEKDGGLTPVMTAAYHHQADMLVFISKKTCNLNIFESAAMGKINQIARHLARDPLLINAYASDGFQPLGLSCLFGHYETAEYLIMAGAVVNAPSRNPPNATPIQSAVGAGHRNIVQLLLRHNANPNFRENNGFTALHIAAQNGDTEIIRLLLFNGADMSIRSHAGKTPPELAMEAGHAEATALFKEGITRRFRTTLTKN